MLEVRGFQNGRMIQFNRYRVIGPPCWLHGPGIVATSLVAGSVEKPNDFWDTPHIFENTFLLGQRERGVPLYFVQRHQIRCVCACVVRVAFW